MLLKHGLAGLARVAAGGAVYTDNFNRANETLQTSANWTVMTATLESNKGNIVSNRVSTVAAGEEGCRCSYEGGTPANNQYAQIKVTDAVTTGTNQNQFWVFARYTDWDNCYFMEARPVGRWTIKRRLTGTQVDIADTGSGTDPITVNDVLRIECNGTTIRALLNGSEILNVTDSNHTSGKCGVGFQQLAASAVEDVGFDDFECGDL